MAPPRLNTSRCSIESPNTDAAISPSTLGPFSFSLRRGLTRPGKVVPAAKTMFGDLRAVSQDDDGGL